jgi:starch synthase
MAGRGEDAPIAMLRKFDAEGAPLRIAYATSEFAPLVKTGGLGDVAGALPAALRALGHDVRVVLPGYPAVVAGGREARQLRTLETLGRLPAAALYEAMLPGDVPAFIVHNRALYDRAGGPYQDADGRDWPDNVLRFGLLSRAAAALAEEDAPNGWRADVVHANDWQTALAPAYGTLRGTRRAAQVVTIHNMAFQGVFDPNWVIDLGLPPESFTVNGVEYYGRFSFLKAGLYYADAITTVSPTYAQEIQRTPGGMGLQGLLAGRRDRLTGILNGIDTAQWNPRTDRHLGAQYDEMRLDTKALNKGALQRELGLTVSAGTFLIGAVARISHQKGLDLLIDITPKLVGLPAQLVVLGAGDAALERRLQDLAAAHRGIVAVIIGFDEALAHRIEGGVDAFVMPSRFEPCGLNQMYSQRYGTPPIVHRTGGLADSVDDCSPDGLEDGTSTGFAYPGGDAASLLAAVARAEAAFRDPAAWRMLQRNGMRRDFSWASAARAYAAVYERWVSRPR